MSDAKSEQAKGRADEAAGDATSDDDLERGGQIDQTTGKVDQEVDDAVDAVKDAAHRD